MLTFLRLGIFIDPQKKNKFLQLVSWKCWNKIPFTGHRNGWICATKRKDMFFFPNKMALDRMVTPNSRGLQTYCRDSWHFSGWMTIPFGHAKRHNQTKHKVYFQVYTLPETNSSDLEMDGWNNTSSFLLRPGLFSGVIVVSGRVRIIHFETDEWLVSSPQPGFMS